MRKIQVLPTDTAQWLALISEAQANSQIKLHEEIESYLVFMLMRFMGQPEMASSILGLEFLTSAHCSGQKRQDSLRDVGDKCLIVSGLFPGRAQKRSVRLSYFVELGQTAYSSISTHEENPLSDLFSELSERFVHMRDVLYAIRALSPNDEHMNFWQALDLWEQTKSPCAKKIIDEVSPHFIHHEIERKQ